MRYCIGCRHLYFQEKDRFGGSTLTGSFTVEEAAIACAKGHWRTHLIETGPVPLDFEKAMESAETCADYSERDVPEAPLRAICDHPAMPVIQSGDGWRCPDCGISVSFAHNK